MARRGVGGTVVIGAVALAVGVALGVVVDRACTERAPAGDGTRGERGRVVEATPDPSRKVAPETADAPPRENVALEAKRDDAKVATNDEQAELAKLREQVRLLEAEVARLEAIVAANDPQTKRVREAFALNELRYGALDREIVELAYGDPESVAEDPRRMCDLLLRLIDETGLLAAPFTKGNRDFDPEPTAPGISLHLQDVSSSQTLEGSDTVVTNEQASLTFRLELPRMPDHWLGNPLSLQVEWSIGKSSDGHGSMMLGVEDPTRNGVQWSFRSITWGINWQPDAVYTTRAPIRGGDDHFEGGPRDLPAERRMVEELFDKLRSRARG